MLLDSRDMRRNGAIVDTSLSRNCCPVSKPGLSPDWDEIPAFLKLPGYVPDRKNQHGLTLADVPVWLHGGRKP